MGELIDMENLDVQIKTLPPMRVATFAAYSPNPEIDARQELVAWAKSHGYWQEPPAVRIFGFDNPMPSEGSPNYGYEYWLTVGSEIQANDQIKIKDFSGGLYAVLRCDVTRANPYDVIPATWQKLVKWLETSHYKHGIQQWLEEELTRNEENGQNFILDLYLPIAE
jgi:AraC family transcriptional regulator